MKWVLGICVVAVITGIAATMTVPAQTVTPDEAILKLFPAETSGVAVIDIASLKNAPLVQDFIRQQSYPTGAQEFITATGVDPVRDIDKVTLGLGPKNQALAIAQGRFDHFKIEQYLRDQNVSNESYLGRVIYSPPAEVTAPGSFLQLGIAFIDNVVLAGNVDSVKQGID